MQVHNLETGKKQTLDKDTFSLAIENRAIQYMRIPYAFRYGTQEGEAFDVLAIENDGKVKVYAQEYFLSEFADIEFATPHFRTMSRGEFVKLAIKRGAQPTEAGAALQTIDDIKQITDGKKPVYVIEMTDLTDEVGIENLVNMCTRTNLAALIVPKDTVAVIGEVE